jgi:O-antigen ligase
MLGCAGATLIVNPWFGFDPINLPKLFVVSVAAGALLPATFYVIAKNRLWFNPFVMAALLFCAWLLIAFFRSDSPPSQQLYGVWGRSTGLIAYFTFILLMLASSVFVTTDTEKLILKSFERTTYFLTFYTTIQYLGSDPLKWSQQQMFGTLGNINFMSALLGAVSVLFVSRMISSKATITSRLHYFGFIVWNLFLIWKSGSIQGIGIFSIGISTLLIFWLYFNRGKIWALIVSLLLLALGGAAIMGASGQGFFSALKQDTLLYRTDYWRAGLSMIQSNPVFGLGIDSYGDYYRFYRDELAVTRTGPGRISNTAHNVFLDIGSGAGIIALLLFIFVILFSIIIGIRALAKTGWNENLVPMISMLIAFQFFFLVSINQIGVAVWIFLFMGMIVNSSRRALEGVTKSAIVDLSKRERSRRAFRSSSDLENSDNTWANTGKKYLLITALASSVLAIYVVTSPMIADTRFLNFYKGRQVERVSYLFGQNGLATFHREKAVELLVEMGEQEKATQFAEATLKINPRSFFAWTVLALGGGASTERSSEARDALRDLDPRNPEFAKPNP